MAAKRKKRWYLVPYRVTYQGIAEIEADSKEAAESIVEYGEFDEQAGQERTDWEKIGPARLRDDES